MRDEFEGSYGPYECPVEDLEDETIAPYMVENLERFCSGNGKILKFFFEINRRKIESIPGSPKTGAMKKPHDLISKVYTQSILQDFGSHHKTEVKTPEDDILWILKNYTSKFLTLEVPLGIQQLKTFRG